MGEYHIRQVFEASYGTCSSGGWYQTDMQKKAARAILDCRSGKLSCNVSRCSDCGHMEFHNNSCRNRNCPECQAVLKEVWVDKRRAKVIDSP